MNFYFNFFDDAKTEYVKADSNNNKVKTNLDKFNLKIFYNEFSSISYDKITDFNLIIERENNGIYYFYKKYSATLDSYDMTMNFNNCSFDVSSLSNEKFKIYLELYETGITVYTGKNEPFYIELKNQCDDFTIDVENTKKINDVYEFQNGSEDKIEEVSFNVTLLDKTSNNTLLIYSVISPDEEIEYKTFEPLGKNSKKFTVEIVPGMFSGNETYIHVALKDTFGNIRYKKVKLLASGSTFSSLEIFSDDIIVVENDGNIGSQLNLMVEYVNVESLTPVLVYSDDKIVASKTFGSRLITDGKIQIEMNEYFEKYQSIMMSYGSAELYFILNEDESSVSNSVVISYDNSEPVVKLLNLDSDNYILVKDSVDYFTISGTIFESNLFYIGGENKKCTLENASYSMLIESEDVEHVDFDGKVISVSNYKELGICKAYGNSFRFLDGKYNEIKDVNYITDWVEDNEKKLYMVIESSKLSDYEKNIIKFQGGLVLKGALSQEIKSQKFIEFDDKYIIEAIVDKDKDGKFSFDLGISDFDYSFTKYILKNNISCSINEIKEVDLGFKYTRIIEINTIKDTNFIKFNDTEKINTYTPYTSVEISYLFLSLKSDEYFTADIALTYFDDYLNKFPYVEIYTKPTLKDTNGVSLNYKNYRINKTTSLSDSVDGNYGFELDCPIIFGMNYYILEFSDVVGKTASIPFIIEKNDKNVELVLEQSKMRDSEIIEEDDIYRFTSNSDKIAVSLKINNETKKQLSSERYIIVKNGESIQKVKISNGDDYSTCLFYLNNSEEEINYEVYYEDTSNYYFTIVAKQQDELTLEVESEFLTGGNIYYLEYKKDDFSKLELSYTNKEAFTCYDKGSYIEILRTNNDSFMEDIELKINLYDNNGNYQVRSKVIKGIFYNDTIVVDYNISEDNLDEERLITPKFNLEIKSYAVDSIKSIYYSDPFEVDIFKRKKYARYDSNSGKYIISNIISPIVETSLELSFVLNTNDLVIRKTLFEDDKIKLEKDIYEFSVSSQQSNGNIDFVVKSIHGKISLNKAEVLCNDVVIKTFEEIEFANEYDNKVLSVDVEGLGGYNTFYLKFETVYGKVVYSKIFEYDFTARNLNIDLGLSRNKYIKTKEEANTITVTSSEKSGKIILEAVDLYGNEKKAELKNGVNIIDVFDYGIYAVRIYFVDYFNKKQILRYKMQVLEDIEGYAVLQNRVFENIKKVTSLSIKNESIFSDTDLGSYLTHYVNGNFIKNYYPKYSDGKINFTIEKSTGLNELYYNDVNQTYKLSEFNHVADVDTTPALLSVRSDDETIISVSDQEIIMAEYSDIYLTTKNIGLVKVYSKKFGRISKRKASSTFETTIPKILMPCELMFCDSDENELFDEPVVVSLYEPQTFTFKMSRVIGNVVQPKTTVLRMNVSDYIEKQSVETFTFKLKSDTFHPLLQTANGIAKYYGNTDWFNFDKYVRNNIIKQIDGEVYSELKRNKMPITLNTIKEKTKAKLKSIIGGNNFEQYKTNQKK